MDVLSSGPVPGHLGLIMDGNRRFAKKRGIGLKQGHTAGAESLSTVCQVPLYFCKRGTNAIDLAMLLQVGHFGDNRVCIFH